MGQQSLQEMQDLKEELIVRLNEAEEALEKTRAEAGEMANELVNQYNRFQRENQELKEQLEEAHAKKLESLKMVHDQEKAQLLDEFESKVNEFNNEGLAEQVNEQRQTISELETELKARDDEMAQLTDDLADLIPVSETLKDENEQLKAQMEEGDQERIDMLGHIDAESRRVETLKKDYEELKKKENKTNNENTILRESIAKLGEELAQYQANSTAPTTITQLGDQTRYIPIVPNQIVEGRLSDSEAETETENDKL